MHNNTILGQILQMFSRYEFRKAVEKTKTEYHARGFSSWNQFSAMLFGQLCGQDSLRNIEAGLATQATSLYHLGIKPIHRATLGYANEHRSHELFKEIFSQMLSKCQDVAPKHKFRFKNPLYSIDATTVDLCLSLYNWAKFRTTKGAVKIHFKLNHAGYLPVFVVLTNGKVHEQTVALNIPFEKGDIAVFDLGYSKLEWLKTLTNKGVLFVTRQKCNAAYTVLERRPTTNKNILCDQIIEMKGDLSKEKYPYKLRRIRTKDPVTKKTIVILTNNFEWAATTIAKIYKERWQIELFFKTLKQQLQIKSFVGTSQNALLSQLWIALTAYLMLSYLKFRSKFSWSIYTLCSILPANLFAKRNIWDWLNAPYQKVSKSLPSKQLKFNFG